MPSGTERLEVAENLSAGQWLRAGDRTLSLTSGSQLVLHDPALANARLLWDGTQLPDFVAGGTSTLRIVGRELVFEQQGGRPRPVTQPMPGPIVALKLTAAGVPVLLVGPDEHEFPADFVMWKPPAPVEPVPAGKGRWERASGTVRGWPIGVVWVELGLIVAAFVLAALAIGTAEPGDLKVPLLVASGICLGLGVLVLALRQPSGGLLFGSLIGIGLLVLCAYETLKIDVNKMADEAQKTATAANDTAFVLDDYKTALAGQHAQIFALGCLAFAVLVFVFVLPRLHGVTLGQVLSPETTSASTVLVLWTFIVVFAIALIAGYQVLSEGAPFACEGSQRYCFNGDAFDYLILLGVPGAAAALTRGAADPAPRALAEAGAGANEGLSVSASEAAVRQVAEAQYFIFNAVAMAFVAFALLRESHRLPVLPDLLLALTGASALAYTLGKAKPKP